MSQSLRPKILITEALPLVKEERRILEKHAIVKIAQSCEEHDLVNEVSDADLIMVVYARITKKIIDSAKNLKGIVRYGIGVDNIDLETATRRRILVANVPDYCVGAVADYTFSLLLTLSRKLMLADQVVKTRGWEVWTSPSSKLKGIDLERKVLGLVGVGKIGRAVAARAKGFDMKIIGYDPYLNKEMAKAFCIELCDLETLLKNSDFISIHAPLTADTRGMIGEREMQLMKKTAYIINTARGPIINEMALYNALKSRCIAGAGIDVYEKEPPDFDNPLLELENIVLTPHIAYYTEQAILRLEMSAVDEAVRILQGRLPTNLVNRHGLE